MIYRKQLSLILEKLDHILWRKMSSGSGGVLEFTTLSQEVFRSEAKVGTRIGAWEQN